jgi:hypothetical protein
MPKATLALVLSCLILGSASAGEIVPMNSRSFQIPITIKGDQKAKIKELLLFVSKDQGQTWSQVAAAKPDKTSFEFFAPADGLYWFSICVVNSSGNREPKDIYKVPPGQKVLVDTMKPSVRITNASRRGDELFVSWEIQEENADLNTFKLEYHTADAPDWMWYAAQVPAALKGQGQFRFVNSGPVQVRVTLADQAGNIGTAQAEIPGSAPPTIAAATTTLPTPIQPPATVAMPPPSPPAALSPPPLTAQVVATNYPTPQPSPVMQADPHTMERPWMPAQSNVYLQANAYIPETTPRYASQQPASWPGYQGQTYSSSRYSGNLMIPTQITNKSQVNLDYEVTRVGPSGVGSVELYITEDDGQTWRRYGEDPKLTPPFVVNNLPDGSYGLKVVVRSRAGLGGRPPKPGDYPQMRLEVDTTPPVVRMLPPQPDPNRRNVLLLSWTASDKNLGPCPITLQWAERPNSQWHDIATDLVHSGRYAWSLTPDLPYRVFLRVLARDTAGNVGSDETPEPVLVDLQEPEAQILGLSGTTRR